MTTIATNDPKQIAKYVARIVIADGGDAVAFVGAMEAILVADGQPALSCTEVAWLIRRVWWPAYKRQQKRLERAIARLSA